MEAPTHQSPPLLGEGLIHSRILVLVPPPQVLLQAPYAPQLLHRPFIASGINIRRLIQNYHLCKILIIKYPKKGQFYLPMVVVAGVVVVVGAGASKIEVKAYVSLSNINIQKG